MGSGIMHTDGQLSPGQHESCNLMPADRYPPFWAPSELLYDATATDAGLDEGNHRGLIRISAEPNAMQLPLPRQVMPSRVRSELHALPVSGQPTLLGTAGTIRISSFLRHGALELPCRPVDMLVVICGLWAGQGTVLTAAAS